MNERTRGNRGVSTGWKREGGREGRGPLVSDYARGPGPVWNIHTFAYKDSHAASSHAETRVRAALCTCALHLVFSLRKRLPPYFSLRFLFFLSPFFLFLFRALFFASDIFEISLMMPRKRLLSTRMNVYPGTPSAFIQNNFIPHDRRDNNNASASNISEVSRPQKRGNPPSFGGRFFFLEARGFREPREL